MRKRYSIFLSGTLTADATSTITFPFDPRTVIPVSERSKKFILYSAFNTGLFGAGALVTGLEVGLNLPNGYNKSLPQKSYVPIGIANRYETTTAANTPKYYYGETDCLVRMIDYPELSQIVVSVVSVAGVALTAIGFSLNLTFEECEEYKD